MATAIAGASDSVRCCDCGPTQVLIHNNNNNNVYLCVCVVEFVEMIGSK